jgi:acyl-CoA reductase-like NAD-dependent aldehyde dehydrogenase
VIDSDKAAVPSAVALARETIEAGVWRNLTATRRADVLWRAAEIIRRRVDELADIEARDNGMSRTHARNLVLGSTEILPYSAGWCTKIHGPSVHIIADGGTTEKFQEQPGSGHQRARKSLTAYLNTKHSGPT